MLRSDNPTSKLNSKGLRSGRDLLIAGSESLGLHLSQLQLDTFLGYLNLLTLWNSRFNLTSINSTDGMIRLHFLDSLAIVRFINAKERLMDLGSGAGLPGIPIKIYYPDKPVVLVEAHNKKANFLREVIRRLNLDAIQVVSDRAETLNPEKMGTFKELVSRASGPLPNLMKLSAPLVSPGGSCFIMSGPSGLQNFADDDIRLAALKHGFIANRIEEYGLPFGKEIRTLLSFKKK